MFLVLIGFDELYVRLILFIGMLMLLSIFVSWFVGIVLWIFVFILLVSCVVFLICVLVGVCRCR